MSRLFHSTLDTRHSSLSLRHTRHSSLVTPHGAHHRFRRRPLTLALLFVWLWGAFCYFSHGPNWGVLTRLNLVMALVDDGAVVVDPYRENTGDNAFYEGHFYHEKAPGGAALGLLPYRVYRWFTPRPPFEPWTEWSQFAGRALYAVTCLSTALLSAAACVVLFRLIRGLLGDARAAFGATVLYAFGTNAFIYSAQFMAHQMGAALVVLALDLAWRARRAAAGVQGRYLAGVGLCLGALVAVEYQDALVAAAVGVYLLAVLPRRRRILWALAAAIPPLALVMLYNRACFGSPFSVGYAHLWGGWDRLHRGHLLGFGAPRLRVLAQLLAGTRLGLLLYAPAAALAVPGALLWWRRKRHRAELLLAAGVCLLFPVYLSGFANALSGLQFGPRMLVVMLPFAALLTATAVARAPRLCAVVGLVSGAIVLAGAAVSPDVVSLPSPPLLHRVLLPFVEGRFPVSPYGFVADRCTRPIDYRPFNLGMLLGLSGHASLLPYLAWWTVGFFGLRKWIADGAP